MASPEILAQLVTQVERTSGIQVTCTRDCEVLSDELRAFDSRFPVSVSTLRRFFGLIPKKGHFSKTTLNALARYVGSPSFQAWEARTRLAPTHEETQAQAFPMLTAAQGENALDISNATSAQNYIVQFIRRFSDPSTFQLSATDFDRLKTSIFHVYDSGMIDMETWRELVKHTHLLRFVVEQFPPLDFMNTFGAGMVETYLHTSQSPSDTMYGRGLLAAGMVASDLPWSDIAPHLPELQSLHPGIHPLIQSRIVGLQLLCATESPFAPTSLRAVRELALRGLREGDVIWPRWAHQNCYFAFNLADWAVMAGDAEIIEAVKDNIASFQDHQDFYNRDVAMEAIKSLRQVWNWIALGDLEEASKEMEHATWPMPLALETRTLHMWHHGAKDVLGMASSDLCMANVEHGATLTGYRGFERRMKNLVQTHRSSPKK